MNSLKDSDSRASGWRQMEPGAVVMHAGPDESRRRDRLGSGGVGRCVDRAQVSAGVAVRMAVMYLLLGGQPLAGAAGVSPSEEVAS